MIKICAILLLFASFLSHAASFKNGQFLKRVVQESEKVLLPLTERLTSIKSAVNRSNVSTSCQESLSRLIESVRDHGRWAFEVADSSSKVASGFYEMEWIWNPGNEEQCLKVSGIKTSFSIMQIEIPENPNEGEDFVKLFGSDIAHKNRRVTTTRKHLGFFHGICHPSSCSAVDLSRIINEYFNHQIDFNLRNVNRSLKSEYSYLQKFSVTLLGLILIVNISSTIKYNSGTTRFIYGFRSFDTFYNTRMVLGLNESMNTQVKEMSAISTRPLNGLKTFYFILSVFFHQFLPLSGKLTPLFTTFFNMLNKHQELPKMFSRSTNEGILFNMMISSMVSVMTWFSFMKSTKKDLNISTLIILRTLRVLPIIITFIAIFLAAPMIQSTGSGILFNPLLDKLSKNCENNGWMQLLFIENFVPVDGMCIIVSWFLFADLQVAIICFPLLIVLYNKFDRGIKLAVGYIILGIVSTYLSLWFTNVIYVSPSYDNLDSYEDSLNVNLYWPTNHISTYAVGLVLGAMIWNGIKIPGTGRMSDSIKTLFIILSLVTSLLFSFSTRNINYWEDSHEKLFIAAISKTVGTLLIAITMYMFLYSGSKSAIKNILTSKFHDYVSKCSFPIYLCHFLLILWIPPYTSNNPIDIRPLFIQRVGAGFVIFSLSFIFGLILHILVEVPFMKLTKAMFSTKK